ncbi:hypothetical protein SZ63_05630 [Methanoculleus sediminis]|uniref:Peptidase M48 domain-containing protein n=1 Tax=Methanoculleus sediminis TaxID=1550566 RepID=A0A0H1R016_9EURY|nr:M48 family metalloprotease [Methanoculleus sediminis]KLK88493.1 hypothetical protein SZ63_05630 [Methanoculleus sediminis]
MNEIFLTESIKYIVLILIVLGASIYYITRKQFWQSFVGLIVMSYFQGLLISLWLFSDAFLIFFTVSVLIAIYYYLFFHHLLGIIASLKSKRSPETKEYEDSNVLSRLDGIWGLTIKDYAIKVYDGQNSFGAFTNVYGSPKEILIGEKLKEKLNTEETVFVISHEAAHHARKNWYRVFYYLFPLIYMIPCSIIAFLLVYLGIANIFSFCATAGLLFILGVITVHYTFWNMEYMADLGAVRKTSDKINAISALGKIAETVEEKRINKLVSLLTSDHPSTEDRILKISAEKM